MTEVSEENRALHPFNEFLGKGGEMDVASLLSEVKELNSAREILDHVVYYFETHNRILEPEFEEQLKEIIKWERIYGRMARTAVKAVEDYFVG